MLDESYRHGPRIPEHSEDLVVLGWVEAQGDIAGLLLIQEVDESQEDPGISPNEDVLYCNGRPCTVDEFIRADPDQSQD
jgi:hypothetical protein